jgi:hypothetical protein
MTREKELSERIAGDLEGWREAVAGHRRAVHPGNPQEIARAWRDVAGAQTALALSLAFPMGWLLSPGEFENPGALFVEAIEAWGQFAATCTGT